MGVAAAVWAAPTVFSLDAVAAQTLPPPLRFLLAGLGPQGDGRLAVSTDGDVWTLVPALTVGSGVARAATLPGGIAAATSPSGTVVYSGDQGVTWNASTLSVTGNVVDTAGGSTRMIAAAPAAAVTSTDGSSWSAATMLFPSNIVRVDADDTTAVAVSSAGNAYLSITSGTLFLLGVGIGGLSGAPKAVLVRRANLIVLNGLCLVGDLNGQISVSAIAPALLFTAATNSPGDQGSSGIADFARHGTTNVAVTTDGGVWIDSAGNGLNWNPAATPPSAIAASPVLHRITSDGTRLVATTVDGTVFLSDDGGANWFAAAVSPNAITSVGTLDTFQS